VALEHLALVAGGVLVGLVLLEVGFRVLAVVAPQALSRSRPVATDGGVRLMCVGDSHTYGAMVAPELAYPEQLERQLRAHGIPAIVYNLGLPGQSTRQVLERLPHQLAVYRPDVVLVWAGVNNFWNLKGRENDPDGPRHRFGLNELRLYRFLNLLRAGRATEEAFEQRRLDAQFVEGDIVDVHRWRIAGPGGEELIDMPIVRGNLDPAAVEAVTRDDLVGIARLVRAQNARVAFFAYPFSFTENTRAVNRAIVAVAASEAVPVIDTGPVAARLQRSRRADVAFKDMHPKPTLYRVIAGEAARRLAQAGLVPRHVPTPVP
jgi:hypothetical protein